MNYFTIPDHLREDVNKRRDELKIQGWLWPWFDRQLAFGRCVVISPKGKGAVEADWLKKYLDL